jgi:hypothetical protein
MPPLALAAEETWQPHVSLPPLSFSSIMPVFVSLVRACWDEPSSLRLIGGFEKGGHPDG